jgi:demethylmacrocin O-methyltransferase
MKTVLKRALDWDNLSPGRRDSLRTVRRMLEDVALGITSLCGASLTTMARIANTKDFGGWGSTACYDRAFRSMRWRKISLLEIGVGGYDDHSGGQSLRLWRAYFPRATIAAIDLYDKTRLSRGRIKVHQCSQIDRERLGAIAQASGGFDVIIDDGSHINAHQIESFKILWPHLRSGGIYVVEDTQTSYWEGFGGGAVGTPAHSGSCVSFFRGLVDGVNHAEFPDPAYAPTVYDREIVSIQFVHNLILIGKGDNAKPSNIFGRWDGSVVRSAGKIDHAGKITAKP